MQSCVIDGQVRDFNLSGADSLASMLSSLNGDLATSGRFIASLRLNGREVADIDQESSQHLERIGSIEITTESPLNVAGNIIAEGEKFIDGLQDYLVRTAGHYSSDNECAGRYFEEAVQGLQWFVQMIGFIEQTLQLDFNQLSLNGKPTRGIRAESQLHFPGNSEFPGKVRPGAPCRSPGIRSCASPGRVEGNFHPVSRRVRCNFPLGNASRTRHPHRTLPVSRSASPLRSASIFSKTSCLKTMP